MCTCTQKSLLIFEKKNILKNNSPIGRGHERGIEAGGGRGRARYKDEVVPPEEHLHATDDWATPLDRRRLVSLLMHYKPSTMCIIRIILYRCTGHFTGIACVLPSKYFSVY